MAADVPKGKKVGHHVGRVAIRQTGSFNIRTDTGIVQGISHRHCHVVQRGNGYGVGRLPTPTIVGQPRKGALSSRT